MAMISRIRKRKPPISDAAMLPGAEEFTKWLRRTIDETVRIRGPWPNFTHYPPHIVGIGYNVLIGYDDAHAGNYILRKKAASSPEEKVYEGYIPGYERKSPGKKLKFQADWGL